MPGTSNIPRLRGRICGNGTLVETTRSRRRPIRQVGNAEDTLLPDGKRVSFYIHVESSPTVPKIEMAAGVREVHTKPTKCLARGSEAKTS
jgi:hypothetical protein